MSAAAATHVRPRRRLALRPLIGIAVAVAVTACGGSYTKQDFVARANGICTDTLGQTRAIAPTGAPQSNRALAAYLRRVLPILQQEAGQLRALRRPPDSDSDKAALDRYLSALDVEVAATRRLRDAASRNDGGGVSAAESDLQASQAASLAARYGLKSCAAPGSTAV
jgi:hypothetical protein